MREDLEAKAEKLFPMPLNPCRWVRAKIEWKRQNWINTKKQENARI